MRRDDQGPATRRLVGTRSTKSAVTTDGSAASDAHVSCRAGTRGWPLAHRRCMTTTSDPPPLTALDRVDDRPLLRTAVAAYLSRFKALPDACRVRPARILGLVRRASARSAGGVAAADRVVGAMDAGDPPAQAVHDVEADVDRRWVLPDRRHRRPPRALPGRARPPTPRPPPSHPPSASPTCSSKRCSPPHASHRTGTTSR